MIKTSWGRLENVFWRRRRKTSSRRLQDVFIKTNVCWEIHRKDYLISMTQHSNIVLSACLLFCGLSYDISLWMKWSLYLKRQDKVAFRIEEFKIFTSYCATDGSSMLTNFSSMFLFYILWKHQKTKSLFGVRKVFRANRKWSLSCNRLTSKSF